MPTLTDGNRKTAGPGPKAVGFRAPGHRQSDSFTDPAQPKRSVPPSDAVVRPENEPTSRNTPPMKKRAKGSGFFGFLFLTLFVIAGYTLWSSFLKFQSYGLIEGRLVSVAAPWNGTLISWQVRDGELVQQGDILANVTNLKMQHELAALGDELKMTQAQLDSEMSRIRFEVQGFSERSQKAVAEHLQASGELVQAKAKLEDLDAKLDRARRLLKSRNLSKSKYEALYYEHLGQKRKIEKLEEAVAVLKHRGQSANHTQCCGSPQLKPLLAKIDRTQSEMTRLRQRIEQGQLRAPVSGRVTKRFCLTGEAVSQGDPVLEILEDNSIEAVLYVPQRLTDEFEVSTEVEILLEPCQYPLTCTVRRVGDRFEPAPSSIARYYHSNQYLLPVYLEPHAECNQLMAMRIHGTVKRPYEWTKAIQRNLEDLQARWFAEVGSRSEKEEARSDIADYWPARSSRLSNDFKTGSQGTQSAQRSATQSSSETSGGDASSPATYEFVSVPGDHTSDDR
jgi:multidrug resistance efflux pump